MTLKELLQYLLDNQYLLAHKGKYTVTRKFYDDVQKVDKSNAVIADLKLSVVHYERTLAVLPKPIMPTFLQFILDSQVPARLEGSNGDVYAANKYSEGANKIFVKAIAEGIDYSILVNSTTLYYKSSLRYKKTIGNYFIQGDWKTDYLTLKDKAGAGGQELKDHINKELEHGGASQYSELG